MSEALIFMNRITIIDWVFIIGGYFLLGLLISAIIGSFTDMELENYVFASLLFWPIVLLIGAIFQLINFAKAIFKGEY